MLMVNASTVVLKKKASAQWTRPTRRIGFEVKLTDAPRVTPSMRHALADLRLDRLWVVHGGDFAGPLAERIHALPLRDVATTALV